MSKKKCAVFTLEWNELFHLPLWLRYYGRHFAPEDMYIINHFTPTFIPSIWATLDDARKRGCNVENIFCDQLYNTDWYLRVVHNFRDELLQRYEYVLFTDVDEWIIPKEGTLRDFIATADRDAYRCTGYEVIETVMHAWGPDDKPLLARIPLVWGSGCHTSDPDIQATDDLFLYHLHRLDYQSAWEKRQRYQSYPHRGPLYQEVVDEERYREIFNTVGTTHPESYHQRLRDAMYEVITGG